RVRILAAPLEAGRLHRACQHRLPVGHARQGDGVEHAEGMERVALVLHPGHRGVEEVEVEVGVVADQDRALAFVPLHRGTYHREHVVQRLAFGLGHAERMVEDDAGDLERLGIDLGARRRFEMRAGDFARDQLAVLVDLDRDRGQFQQRVPVPVETAGLHVDDDREVTAETIGHAPERASLRLGAGGGLGHAPRVTYDAPGSYAPGSCRVAVPSRLSRGGRPSPPWTRNHTFSAMLVAWSPMRSMFLAMNSRWVQEVMLRGSSIM